VSSGLNTMQILVGFEPEISQRGSLSPAPPVAFRSRPYRPARRKLFYTSIVSGGSRRSESLFTAPISCTQQETAGWK
jgi:hypothetical protein